MTVEMRELPEDQADSWKEKIDNYESVTTKLAKDIEKAETAVFNTGIKCYLFKSYIDIDEMSAKEVTQQALQIQEKSQQSTSRAKQALNETIEVYKFILLKMVYETSLRSVQ